MMDPPSSQIPSSAASWTTTTTVEHCPTCRVASPDVAAARVRVAALHVFARQVRLELEELAALLGVSLHGDAFST